ncbi:Sodium/hydrogen exchanger family-domain-containing protein [Irpex rosettiformis]|uniref:Sodium/hydrogen exchanger family-domain-containing protein n=1 Tax=Irpex rosettiformis TaxID=378272 RepID=A0ACB8U0X7_9APHY|nr:Sodium/hydrogen exchanger family-domain-containing protein [Irpex rosettiformis]
MRFHPFEVSIPHIVYAALGGFVVFFGMFSLFIRERLYIGEAIWAFLFGVVIGPYGANIFDPRSWGNGSRDTVNEITLEVTRVVLAIGVFAIGVELPKAYMKRHWRSLFFLLAPVMTWGWFVSAGLIYALIPKLNFLSSLAVAACLTPTDPILAAAVVGGKYADKHVPAHLRHLLAAESACNDGAAYPFLFIALYLIIDKTTGEAIGDWFVLLWLYQVIMGIVLGALIGIGFRYLMRFCERKDLIDRQSYVAQYVSLAMLTIGTCALLGTDDLLAAFSCGTAFAWDGFFNKQTEESVFSSVIDLLFNIAAFVFVGAWMPFNSFSDGEIGLSVWRLIVIGILVILLRRLPIMVALYKWIPDVKTFREAIFSGHFGPMGVGAIYISTLAAQQLPEPSSPPENQTQLLAASIQPIVAFMVLISILIHGLSIPFFSLGRRVHTVSRTWSRHDTIGRTSIPEWINSTRKVQRGENIVINRDTRDLERGAGLGGRTARGDETPTTTATEKMGGEDSGGESQMHTPTSQDLEKQAQRERREEGEEGERVRDVRDAEPPDGTEILAEWKEGPHKIIERRNGPGEEVDVEVQENAYAPEQTTIHSLSLPEDAARSRLQDVRVKVAGALRSPERNFEHAINEIKHTVSHEAHRAEDAIDHAEASVKHALEPALGRDKPPQSPHQTQTPQTQTEQQPQRTAAGGDEDEEWMSDAEGEGESSSAGETAGAGPSSEAGGLRQKSRSPKIKTPKLAILRPSHGAGGRRRMSIRRGMLGARAVHPAHPQKGHDGDGGEEEGAMYRPQAVPLQAGMSRESSGSEQERGRRMKTADSRASSIRLMHNRVDSLRSIDTTRREASPARSVRWADESDGNNNTGIKRNGNGGGLGSPRILSPVTPTGSLPGSSPPSDDEEDMGAHTPTHAHTQSVRFDMPTGPPARDRR